MTGPEHYKRAEELLAAVETDDVGTPYVRNEQWTITAAQVHATLALAAATALNDPDSAGFYKVDRLEWEAAASAFRREEGSDV